MPRLLQLDSCLGRGSTGRIAETIGHLASQRGWDCYMAHGSRYVGESAMQSHQVGGMGDEYLHYAKSMLFDAHGLGSIHATKKFVAWMEQIAPDVVHLHNIHGYWMNYEVLFEYLYKKNIPVVWTFHDCWAITGHCAMFTSDYCDKWKAQCSNCPHLDWYPKSLFVDRSEKHFNMKKKLFASYPNLTIVSVSNWLDGIVRESFLKDKTHIVIPNGVDTDVFSPQDEAVGRVREQYGLKDKIVIISVADKWHEGIGLSDVSKLRVILDDRFVVMLVGVTQAQKDNLPDGVIGVLHTNSRKELAELYSMADISFTPQTVATFGLVTAESMACGTPAIVYAAAAAEVIDNHGFVVPARDIDTLVQTLNLFVSEGGKRKYGQGCRNHILGHYEEKRNYSRYVDLYESLIKL